ncbi:MAG: DUF309 domain-containing protein [Egibacteraceae bacterium]
MAGQPPRESRYPERDRNLEGRAENARPRDRFGRPLPRGAVDEMAGKRVPDQVASSVAEALDYAIQLFDAQRFFEAHEFLEWIWKSDEVPEGDREFWKGVTQIAVGYTHTQRGNRDGALTLLDRACRYMAPYPPRYQGIDAEALAGGARRVIAEITASGPSADIPFPGFPRARD